MLANYPVNRRLILPEGGSSKGACNRKVREDVEPMLQASSEGLRAEQEHGVGFQDGME